MEVVRNSIVEMAFGKSLLPGFRDQALWTSIQTSHLTLRKALLHQIDAGDLSQLESGDMAELALCLALLSLGKHLLCCHIW